MGASGAGLLLVSLRDMRVWVGCWVARKSDRREWNCADLDHMVVNTRGQYDSQLYRNPARIGSIRIELGCFEKTTDRKGRKGGSFRPGPAIRSVLCGER
jgi:hypothetical protein